MPTLPRRRQLIIATWGEKVALPGTKTPLGRKITSMEIQILLQCFKDRGVPNIRDGCSVYYRDCRCFHDPHRSGENHIGWHPQVIWKLVNAEPFEGFLLSVKKEVTKALANDVVVPVTGLTCNKGRHRSVAFSMVLSYIMEQERCSVWVEHLAIDTWHRGACGGEGCRECTGSWTSRMRDSAYHMANSIWRSAVIH